jgi:hypothetical protein
MVFEAIRNDDAEEINRIAKVDKSCLSNFSITYDSPLMYAMKQDSKNAFVALLKNGADPNRLGANGRNLMTYAAEQKDIFWLKKALELGGDPNLDNNASPQRRCTPLIIAARDDRMESLKLLVEDYKADIDYIAGSDDALTCAASKLEFKAVLYLLGSGADFRRKTGLYTSFAGVIRQKSPEDFLQDRDKIGIQKLIDWLHERGVEWNNPRKDGEAWVY